MTLNLPKTTTSAIADALMKSRHRVGGGTMGMVLTLVIVTDEANHYDALRAATEAGHEHPCRVLVLIQREPHAEPHIDAEIRSSGEMGPGEGVLLRTYGALNRHADAVVIPLLVPDAPVVVWWPAAGPAAPAKDSVGVLAQRRITDSQNASDPVRALVDRTAHYTPGDTDLSWARITPWRTLLASLLDQPCEWISAATVAAEADLASAHLLASWLESKLGAPVTMQRSDGPGITEVRLSTAEGEIAVERPDGRTATLVYPGKPDRTVALPRLSAAEAMAEELRRLDPDEVYEEAAQHLLQTHRSAQPAG
ncbi:glucose-6-phosphate dehydrogenase assembly protein OpcA [Allonocardiopsis opalescens]|uniref:Glucose-6-phosphate dehydrogenase assembly protein OpcA n=1 Tax=Allonocardiopsis opalescens TaxID=1144618 RepID=A0A2T0PUH2_9ACTN|nr:glucose-6-phosphate dehydrogenase assembly protein OpcA [Allonocardiopsis opalescens]PRX92540.1 glucose-6-phosphate dehydrogenase assembly protein OpcA [Allonocardiopsis opalescens]